MAEDRTGTALRGEASVIPDFSMLYRDLREPAWVIDPTTSRFLDANGDAVTQLGFDLDEVRRIGVVDVNRAIPDEAAWRSLTSAMKAGDSVVYSAELVCKSGDSVSVEITLSCQCINGQRVFLAITRSQEQAQTQTGLQPQLLQ